MRFFIKILFACASIGSAFADTANVGSAKDFIERGASFYARGDYSAAKELLAQVKLDGSAESGIAAFFLASIEANEGGVEALRLFEYAAKHAPKGMNEIAAIQCARTSLLNGKAELAKKALDKFATKECSSEVAWYYANALWELDKKNEAKKFFGATLEKDFDDISALGVDIFIDDRISKNAFAQSLDISKLKNSGVVAVSRLEILEGKKITPPQGELSLLGQIEKIDQQKSDEAEIDAQALEKSLAKYSQAPYSWRAALILSEYYTAKKEYQKGVEFAKTAQFLAPPEMAYQGRLLIAEADALRLMKKYNEADSVYLKVVMNKKTRGELAAEATYKTGINWFEQGEWAKAHLYFERVFVLFFKYEFWGARAYYYDAQALYSMGERRDANATLLEYFRRANERKTQIYKDAQQYYRSI